MNYLTYDESGALTGSYTGQEPQEGQDRYFELLEPLEQHWTAYRMSDARDGLELLPAQAPTEPPTVDQAALKAALASSVDSHIAGIYARWTRFETEYAVREAAARAFVAAGYEGDPGVWVTSFSGPAGLSDAAAADRIIAQADALHAALEQLAALRMAKYGILGAADAGAAQAAHDDIIAQADVIAAGLQ
jgi:hypothetical protein